jgi:hypothetical protein
MDCNIFRNRLHIIFFGENLDLQSIFEVWVSDKNSEIWMTFKPDRAFGGKWTGNLFFKSIYSGM